MWLFLVGLALLTGDVLSQAKNVINSETDLLALPSDQLIHSSAELLAIEDQITDLPFGTRLPGYKNPYFAYSYTVKEDQTSGNTVPASTQILAKPSDHYTAPNSKNVILLPDMKLKNNSLTFTKDINQSKKTIGDTKEENKELNNKVSLSISSQHSDEISTLSKETNPNAERIKLSFNPKTEQLSHVSNTPLHSIFLKTIPKAPLLALDHLPHKSVSKHAMNLDNLTPQATLNFGHLTQEEIIPTPSIWNTNYVPPDKEVGNKEIDLEYIKPKEPFKLHLDYLPPDKVVSHPNLNLDYLPPKLELQEPTPNPVKLELDYLPPDKAVFPESLNLDYLPPKTEKTESIPTASVLDLDYLPPEKDILNQGLNLDYLPPKIETAPFKPDINSISKENSLPPISLNQDYLPPNPNDEESKTNSGEKSFQTNLNEGTKELITLNLDYLPPTKQMSKVPSVNLDYLPPSKQMSKLPDLNIDYSPPTNPMQKPQSLNFEYPPTPLAKFPSVVPNPPKGIIRTLVAPTIEFENRNINEPIIPISATKQISSLAVIEEFQHKPNHFKHSSKIFKPFIRKDLLSSSTEIFNQPIIPISEKMKLKPLGLVSKLNIKEINPIHHTNILRPISLPKEFQFPVSPIVPKGVIRTSLVPPTVAFKAKITNEPIIPISEKTDSKLLGVIHSFKESDIFPKHSSRVKPQISIIGTQNEPIIPVSDTRQAEPLGIKSNINRQQIKQISVVREIKPIAINKRHKSPKIEVKRKINYDIQEPVSEVQNDPIIVNVEKKKLRPHALFHTSQNTPITPTKDDSKLPPFAVVSSERETTIQPIKKRITRPESSFKTIENPPIIPSSNYKNVEPFALVEETSVNQISVKRKNKLPSPSAEIKEHINPPIQPILGETQAVKFDSIVSTPALKEYTSNPNVQAVIQNVNNDQIIAQSFYTKNPLSVTYENQGIKIHPLRESAYENKLAIYTEKSKECLSNDECNQKDVCQDGKCIPGCSIAKHLCIGDAICETRHHVPACICPLMFIARTVRNSGFLQFDCTPMEMATSSNKIIERSQKNTSPRISNLSCKI